MAISIRMVQSMEDFYWLGQRWNALLDSSNSNSYFLRWEWLWEWWKAYRRDSWDLSILLAYRGESLVGIAPFYILRGRPGGHAEARTLMLLGTAPGCLISEHNDIICKAGEEEEVIGSMMSFIYHKDVCDEILTENMDVESSTVGLLQRIAPSYNFSCSITAIKRCPQITLPSDYEAFMGGLSRSMRYMIRRNQRRLAAYGNYSFRRTNCLWDLDEDFREMVRLHQLRWQSRAMPGSFAGGKFQAFQKEAIYRMFLNGHLELTFLSVSGRNIAVLYNINYRNSIYFFQAGMDVAFDRRLAPGVLLHDYCIRDAIRRGLALYDFLLMGRNDSYKTRWAKCSKYLCDVQMSRTRRADMAGYGNYIYR